MFLPDNTPAQIDLARPEYSGPYDAVNNGSCACHGAPVNGFGRCEAINAAAAATAATAPPKAGTP